MRMTWKQWEMYWQASGVIDALKAMEEAHTEIAAAGDTRTRRGWFDLMLKLYDRFPAIREVWEYVENVRALAKRFIKRIKPTRIFYSASADYPEGAQLVYLIRLLDRDGGLVWSKVGTTTRTMKKRMKEHLRYYKKYGVASIEVTRVYNCGDLPAEGLESEFRAKYMRKYPGAFRKNDRFTGVEFDLAEADSIVREYLR